MMTQAVLEKNRIVATPRVASVTDDLLASVPAIYAVVVEQVIVMFPVVLLKTEMTLPSANVEFGITMEPPVLTCTYLPMSEVVSVYEDVFVPTSGTLRTLPEVSEMVGAVTPAVPSSVIAILSSVFRYMTVQTEPVGTVIVTPEATVIGPPLNALRPELMVTL